MKYDTIKDSGQRENFLTGSKRDIRTGKGRFDLLPFYAIFRLSRIYEEGAVKYGENNWRLGQPCSRYLDSAIRHLLKAASGWQDEDHFAQAMWNIAAILETQKMIEDGQLPQELEDLKKYISKWEEVPTKEVPTKEVPTNSETIPPIYEESKNTSSAINTLCMGNCCDKLARWFLKINNIEYFYCLDCVSKYIKTGVIV
jgi:hypothetical protein